MVEGVLNACVQIAPNVFYHHNKHLMEYFEFLHGSMIICIPLNIPGKLHWQHLFEKSKKTENITAFILVTAIRYPHTLKDIYHSNKRSDSNPRSDAFC